jgi:hypothetical protein
MRYRIIVHGHVCRLNFGGLSPSFAKAGLNRGQKVKTGKQLSAESIPHFARFLSRLKNYAPLRREK